MLDMIGARDMLHEIMYGPSPNIEPDRAEWLAKKARIIPLRGNWSVPTLDADDPSGDWIGYMIVSINPNIRAVDGGFKIFKSIREVIRLSFLGPNSFANATSSLLWDDRYDVKKVIERYNAQLAYMPRTVRPYNVVQDGMNTEIAWITELTCMSFIEVDTHRSPWVTIVEQGGNNG